MTASCLKPHKRHWRGCQICKLSVTFLDVGQALPLCICQTMHVQPIAADIPANNYRLWCLVYVLFLLITGPERPHVTVRDDEERRCGCARKRGQCQKAQTPYTAPSATSAKVADGGHIAKRRSRRFRALGKAAQIA